MADRAFNTDDPIAYFITWIPVSGFSISGFIEAQRRIFAENSAQHPPHLYMSSWPSWPLRGRGSSTSRAVRFGSMRA